MGKKCDLTDFDHGMIISARQGGLSISETAVISWNFHAQQSLEFAENGAKKQKHPVMKHLANESGQWRRARLAKADRKVTVTQITTHYNSRVRLFDMQKSIFEHTMRLNFKWIGYSSSRPISLKNKSR